MIEIIDGNLRMRVKVGGEWQRVELTTFLFPERVEEIAPFQSLIVTTGWHKWEGDGVRYFVARDPLSNLSVRGLYLQYGSCLYLLARKVRRTPEELLAEAQAHMGEELERFIISVDSAPLYAPPVEVAP